MHDQGVARLICRPVKLLRMAAIVGLAVALSFVPAVGQDGCDSESCLDTFSAKKSVRIGYTQFSPYASTSNIGIAEGYTIDLIRLLLEPAGYSIQFIAHDNPSELLASLEAQSIDATTPLSINTQRETYGLFSDVVHTFSFAVFTASGEQTLNDPKDLVGRRIGVSEGSQVHRLVGQIAGALPVPMDNGDELLMPLLTGDTDAIAGPLASVMYNIRRAGLGSRIEQSPLFLNQADAGFLVDRNKTELLNDFNLAIESAFSKGHISALYDEWFKVTPGPITNREFIAATLSGSAIFLAILYWAWLHYGVRKVAKSATKRANLLNEVLNATGATLMIADRDMRPIWWNDAYLRNYPRHVPLLNRGATMREIIGSNLR